MSAVPTREPPGAPSDPLHVARSVATHMHAGEPALSHGHTRHGADDESRTRGLDPGEVALYPLSYIRKECESEGRPVPASSRGDLLKSAPRPRLRGRRSRADAASGHAAARLPRRAAVDWLLIWVIAADRPNDEGPDPCGIRASFEPALASREGVRLRASLARLHLVLGALQPEAGGRGRQMQFRIAAIRNPAVHCQTDRIIATHGRTTTHGGSKRGLCKSAGVHDGFLGEWLMRFGVIE